MADGNGVLNLVHFQFSRWPGTNKRRGCTCLATYFSEDPMINNRDLSNYLDRLQENYAKAPDPEPEDINREYEPIPDGKYEAVVRMVEIVNSKSSDNLNLKWHIQIVGGKFSGRMVWKYNVLGSEENFRWLKRDLAVMGGMVKDLKNLPAVLEDLQGSKMEIGLKNDSIFINKRLED
jgi:hypothetical protein